MELAIEVSWRLVTIFLLFGVAEHQSHVWFLHSRKIITSSHRMHHVEHHGQGQMKLRPHIDLALVDYFIAGLFVLFCAVRAVFVTPYAWIGVAVVVGMTLGHQYLWSRLHRAIHRVNDHLFKPADLLTKPVEERGERLEDNWTTRQWWFSAFENHHLRHHANPSKNYAVVFLWSDWLFGTVYDRRPWWGWIWCKVRGLA